MNCNQICPYNTLDGCEKDKYNANCPISNSVPSVQDWANAEATEICKAMNAKHDKSEWISVKDRLPQTFPTKVGTEYSEAVVLWTKGRKVLTAIYNGEDFIADAAFWDAEDDEVTHWMPIEPPKEVE